MNYKEFDTKAFTGMPAFSGTEDSYILYMANSYGEIHEYSSKLEDLGYVDTEAAFIASPVTDSNANVFFSGGDNVLRFEDKDGKEKGKYTFQASEKVIQSPLLTKEGMIFILVKNGTDPGNLYAFTDGLNDLKWQEQLSPLNDNVGSPAIDKEGNLILITGQYMYSFKTTSKGLNTTSNGWPKLSRNSENTN